MMSIRNQKRLLEILIAFALILLFYFAFRAFYFAPNDEIPLTAGVETAPEPAPEEISSPPIRLEIPKIDVNAKIQSVGITAAGNMAAPRNFVDVGWYKYGTLPGNLGSAVIAGHVDNGVALPAVFYNLKELATGDDVYVITENGDRLHFKVTESITYDFNARADEVFTDDSGKILRLITCSGVWMKKYRTHDKRLVVSAVLSE